MQHIKTLSQSTEILYCLTNKSGQVRLSFTTRFARPFQSTVIYNTISNFHREAGTLHMYKFFTQPANNACSIWILLAFAVLMQQTSIMKN